MLTWIFGLRARLKKNPREVAYNTSKKYFVFDFITLAFFDQMVKYWGRACVDMHRCSYTYTYEPKVLSPVEISISDFSFNWKVFT